MSQQMKREYSQIQTGDEFPAISYKLEPSMVAAYLRATEEASDLYHNTGLVPPTAIAAYAMKALFEVFVLTPGTIHVSQELEFTGTVNTGETITCQARVSRKQERAKLRLIAIELTVLSQDQKKVMTGKTSLALPEPD